MLRMIRSARSQTRSSQEQSVQNEKTSSRNSMGSAFGVRRRSRTSIEQTVGSENAAPEKFRQVQATHGGVLTEITNTTVVPAPVGDLRKLKPLSVPSQPAPFQMTVAATKPVAAAGPGCAMSNGQNAKDPQQVMEYLPDIYRLLQKKEASSTVRSDYMDRQVHVNAKMRGILVDWLVSVQQKYKLKAETLFLAISLLDSYLELKETARRQLQLVGVTALLIAAKFEEIYPPQISAFVHVTDKTYTSDDIIKMEVSILGALDFKICRPTPTQFLERYQVLNGSTESHQDLAQYLLELTLVDINMLKYSPSRLAAAAVFLSNKLLRKQPSWKEAAAQETNFSEQMLKACAMDMCALLEHAGENPLQAVRKKFSQSKYNSVAKLSFTGPAGQEVQSAPSTASRWSLAEVGPEVSV